jgi:acyl carrier protein
VPDAGNDTLRKIIALLAEVSALEAESIQPKGLLRGYGIDSARVIELFIGIDEQFGVQLQEKDLLGLKTVQDLASLVASRRR